MESNEVGQLKKYIELFLRRKAMIISCLLLGVVFGLGFYLKQAKVYRAEALLSYQQQAINPSSMSPDVKDQIRDIVSTLTQIVTSRTNLEQIIEDVDLYGGMRTSAPMEDIIEMMREKIEITPSKRGGTFTISFSGTDPDKVVRVTNELASDFIEENLKYRQDRASETSEYTQDELEMAKITLDKKEAIMRDYKLKYYNEMPEQQTSNVSRLIALQEQYQGKQESIQDLERTRVLIQDQIGNRRQLLEEAAKQRESEFLNANLELQSLAAGEQQELSRLYAQLEALQDRYTEKHPEIRRLKKAIARLEKSILETSGDSGSQPNLNNSDIANLDSVIADLKIQLKDIKLSIKSLNREKEQVKLLVDRYEKWVDAAPVRESEWAALTREHGELRRHYDFLVSRNLQAGSALNLERKQKGSQFKIEDSARRPENPIFPNFRKVMAIALLVGGGVGCGLAIGLNLLDTSFRDPEELANAFGIEIICSVPYVPLKKEMRRERLVTIFGSFVFLVSISGIGYTFVYLWQQGKIIL